MIKPYLLKVFYKNLSSNSRIFEHLNMLDRNLKKIFYKKQELKRLV